MGFKCSRHTFVQEGFRGFYSGTLPALVAIAAENSLLFMAYGATQRLVSRMAKVEEEELGVLGHGIAGGLAAFWPSLVICPTELVKCRLQAAREAALMQGLPQPKLGPLGLAKWLLATEGVRELLRPKGGCRTDVGALGTVGAGAV